ncbi:MAG: tetratricopeptide repeat protein [Gammaproteobacteria bacterium]|nr:tetratricopeptide repeat protein [Gammaproteobacteria bacterium]
MLRTILLVACLGTQVHVVQADVQTARELIGRGSYDQALQQIDAALAKDPDDHRALFLKGVVLAEQNKNQAAIEIFTRLTREHPELPEPHNNLAVLYAANGEYDKARDALLVAINTHPSYGTAHENLGDVYAKMAGIAYNRAFKLDVDNATAQRKLALIGDLFTFNQGATAQASSAGPSASPVALRPPTPSEAVSSAKPSSQSIPQSTPIPAVNPTPEPTPTPTRSVAATTGPGAPSRSVAVELPPARQVDRQRPPAETRAAAAPAAGEQAGTASSGGVTSREARRPAPSDEDRTRNAPSKASMADLREELFATLTAWAEAWSRQAVGDYLSFYDGSFAPPEGRSRRSWEQLRDQRLSAPSFIKVQLFEPEVVRNDGERAVVELVQRYESNTYQDRVRKRIGLIRRSDGWRITSETTTEKIN